MKLLSSVYVHNMVRCRIFNTIHCFLHHNSTRLQKQIARNKLSKIGYQCISNGQKTTVLLHQPNIIFDEIVADNLLLYWSKYGLKVYESSFYQLAIILMIYCARRYFLSIPQATVAVILPLDCPQWNYYSSYNSNAITTWSTYF